MTGHLQPFATYICLKTFDVCRYCRDFWIQWCPCFEARLQGKLDTSCADAKEQSSRAAAEQATDTAQTAARHIFVDSKLQVFVGYLSRPKYCTSKICLRWVSSHTKILKGPSIDWVI